MDYWLLIDIIIIGFLAFLSFRSNKIERVEKPKILPRDYRNAPRLIQELKNILETYENFEEISLSVPTRLFWYQDYETLPLREKIIVDFSLVLYQLIDIGFLRRDTRIAQIVLEYQRSEAKFISEEKIYSKEDRENLIKFHIHRLRYFCFFTIVHKYYKVSLGYSSTALYKQHIIVMKKLIEEIEYPHSKLSKPNRQTQKDSS